MIEFKQIDETSFYQIINLTVAEEDKTFVAPNVRSLAECWLYRDNGDVFPYAVWAGDQVVGFLLIDIDEDEKRYMIWRVMIDQAHQRKGYGRAVLTKVIDLARSHPLCDHLMVSYVEGNDKMAKLLRSLNFTQVGYTEKWREVDMRLETPGDKT